MHRKNLRGALVNGKVKRGNIVKKVMTLVLSFLLIGVLTTTVIAVPPGHNPNRHGRGGWPVGSSVIPITLTASSQSATEQAAWRNSMVAAVNDANNILVSAGSQGIRLDVRAGAANIARAERFPNAPWYGAVRRGPSMYGNASSSEILLNMNEIIRMATNVDSFIRSVLTHEIGHNFWLGDNPATASPSIMNVSRNRNVMRTFQPFDFESITLIYGWRQRSLLEYEEVLVYEYEY